jgi:hypothetical protein
LLLATSLGVQFAAPSRIHAQAPPGPLHPTKVPEVQQPPQQNPRHPQQTEKKLDFFGSWRLNRDESDNPQRKLQQARGSRRAGNGPYGGYPGGGWGRHGGGMGNPQNNEDRRRMQEFVNPSNSLTIVKKDSNEIDLTDTQGRQRVFYTDGRKLQKSTDENHQETVARWDGTRLVSEEKGPWGGKMTRTLELDANGEQLLETFQMKSPAGSTMVIRYVYDGAPENRPR